MKSVYVIVYGNAPSRVVRLKDYLDQCLTEATSDRPVGTSFSIHPIADETPIDDVAAMYGNDVAASVSRMRLLGEPPDVSGFLSDRLASLQGAIEKRNDLELAELYLLVVESVAHLVGGLSMNVHSFGDLTLSRPIPRSAK